MCIDSSKMKDEYYAVFIRHYSNIFVWPLTLCTIILYNNIEPGKMLPSAGSPVR